MATDTVLYLLNNTDDSLQLVIQPRTFDGFGGVQRNTDLTLYGNGAPNWGERFNENFFRMLENFAVEEKDSSTLFIPQDETDLGDGLGINFPLEGQQWYNKTRRKLFVYDGTNWKPSSNHIGNATSAELAPGGIYTPTGIYGYTPEEGQLAFNTTVGALYTWNGTEWTAATSTADFVIRSGDTMTGHLTLSANPVNALHAVTKQYVDVNAITPLSNKVSKTGDSMSGTLSMGATINMGGNRIENVGNPNSSDDAATVQWSTTNLLRVDGGNAMNASLNFNGNRAVNMGNPAVMTDGASAQWVQNNYVRLNGGNTPMTGYLTLNANPVNPMHAATKAYVDSVAGGSAPKGPYFLSTPFRFYGRGYPDIPGGPVEWTTVNAVSNGIPSNVYSVIIQAIWVMNDPNTNGYLPVDAFACLRINHNLGHHTITVGGVTYFRPWYDTFVIAHGRSSGGSDCVGGFSQGVFPVRHATNNPDGGPLGTFDFCIPYPGFMVGGYDKSSGSLIHLDNQNIILSIVGYYTL